jgi:uncharacterized membrane protein YidH (DUF202 family)
MGVVLSGLVTPSVLITAGAIVLNAFTERYDKLWDGLKSGDPGVTRPHLQRMRVSILAVLVGLCSLALSVVALTLAEVFGSGGLGYLAVALVLMGAIALVLGIAYTAIVLLRRPELGPCGTGWPVNPSMS